MDLTSPKIIKELLTKRQASPSKGLGQNFLIDRNILEKIIGSSEIKKTDLVLEVGPGVGTLTAELAKKAKKVVAVEKDEIMTKILSETLEGLKNIEIKNEDILRYKLPATNYKVVANIPYYLTSPLIRILLENKNQPKEMVLMMQKEVAQRICATPPNMSLLAVSVQFYAKPEILFYVSKNSFYPAPKIDSAVIKIVPSKKPSVDTSLFFKVVKAGFSHPRKQLANNLAGGLHLDKEKIGEWLMTFGIEPSQRAETLGIEDWTKLAENFDFLQQKRAE